MNSIYKTCTYVLLLIFSVLSGFQASVHFTRFFPIDTIKALLAFVIIILIVQTPELLYYIFKKDKGAK